MEMRGRYVHSSVYRPACCIALFQLEAGLYGGVFLALVQAGLVRTSDNMVESSLTKWSGRERESGRMRR